MAIQQQWMTKFQRFLLAYFMIEWVQAVNNILYFIVEIVLFVYLTLLPIRVTFNWLLEGLNSFNRAIDIVVVVIFTAHIYLYLNYKVSKLVRNPEIQKKLLFQNKVVRLKWLNLLTIELIYDIICLGVAVFQLINDNNSLFTRLLSLIFLAKIYKIKVFHDRFQNYIIGTSFYVIYNVFYGLFILIILVSYVGCIFYQIDHILYDQNYQYQSLLWVNQSAWNDIIHSEFGVQLLYAIYWSIGTASSAAYGDIAASAPPDVVYNIICLYFQGFLFGFYLSRIHSLPASLIQKENELLQLFQTFQEHNNQIKAQGEHISQELYFKILCSLQYQQSSKKSLSEIESILPKDYIMEIKAHIFRQFIEVNPMNLWQNQELRKNLCLNISQVVFEIGQQLYDYNTISRSDLIYVKKGKVHSYCQIDHTKQFSVHYEEESIINIFGFVTNLKMNCIAAQLKAYSVLFIIKRKDFKALLTPQENNRFDSLFDQMIAFESQNLQDQPIGLYYYELYRKSSDILIMSPQRKSVYLNKILERKDERTIQTRKRFNRTEMKSKRRKGYGRKLKISVGVQCSTQSPIIQMDKLIVLRNY